MNAIHGQFVARATDDGFVKMLSNVLLCVVSENDSNKGVITRFHSMNAPPISISDYVARIARHVRCSNECFVLALVYIERITKLHSNFVVSILNVHRLVITAVMLAAKFSDDVYYSNKFYAQVGGVNVAEINMLEAQFLSMLNFQLYVSAIEYESCRMGVEKANLFGCLSSSLWGIPWFSAGRKRPTRDDTMPEEKLVVPGTTIPAEMPITLSAMRYSERQPTELSCSTRYFGTGGNNSGGDAVTDESQNGDGYSEEDSFARQMDETTPVKNTRCQRQNMETMLVDIPVNQRVSKYQVSVNGGYGRQSTVVENPSYHVLSNVHMPQMETPHNDPVVLALPKSRGIHMNMGVNASNAAVVATTTTTTTTVRHNYHHHHHHQLSCHNVASCTKHHSGTERGSRRYTRFMLNRLCTQHVDIHGYPHSRWNTMQQRLSSVRNHSFVANVDDIHEGTEKCEVFMSALEARYRKPVKGKCAINANPWSHEDDREMYRSRPMIRCSIVRDAE